MPGAVNYSGASMKEIPMISPSQMAGTRSRVATAHRAAVLGRVAQSVWDKAFMLSTLRRAGQPAGAGRPWG